MNINDISDFEIFLTGHDLETVELTFELGTNDETKECWLGDVCLTKTDKEAGKRMKFLKITQLSH